MAMTLVKKTDNYKIYLRGDKRYAVQDSSGKPVNCLLYTSPSPRDVEESRMPSSA